MRRRDVPGTRAPFGPRGGDRPAGPRRDFGDRGSRGPDRGFGDRDLGFADRDRGDRPWRQPAGRPADAYRPGVAPSDLLAEEEELVAGRRPVEEAFVAHRPARRLLVVPQRRQALERLVLHATSLRIPVVEVEGGTLTAVAGFDGHQGVALVVEPRTWAGLDDILARALDRGEPPFVLVLDSLEDPQNVGTLLRSAEAAGVHGVLFPTHRQAPLTPAAIKASAGAVEHLLLCPVDDLPGALSDLRIRGLRVAAAEADAPLTAAQADLRGPLAIIVGSEGQGLSPVVRRRADIAVRIPMRGAIGSLNAAVAGSILLFAAVAQRDPDGSGDETAQRAPTFDELADTMSAPPNTTLPDPDGDTSIEAAAEAGVRAPRKRTRPPAPTTAAQKRSRAAKEPTPGPGDGPPDAEPPTEPAAKRRRTKAPATPDRPAAEAGVDPDTSTTTAAAPPPPARQSRARKAASASNAADAAPAESEAGADDLLPGGPPGD
jgi:23S rRNA (guanosine2251-2'-O)-methyltransferase